MKLKGDESMIKEEHFSKSALTVLEKRYLTKDDEGNIIETPKELFKRVAENVSSVDKKFYDKYEEIERDFFNVMWELKFLPNTPTLINAGRDLQQLSACFVLPIYDSMDSIFEAIKNTALIHKSGGGTGFDFSGIRPRKDVVHSTGGIASGPVSFMKVFDSATEAVKQGGTRRGANMAILRIDHPDIKEFIRCKENEGEIANFNISVALTDLFMKAVENGEEYSLINPRNKAVVSKIGALEIFDRIIEGAWKNGEPGIIFLDKINETNPTPALGEIEATNPCGEQPLLPYESCNLGSINLSKMVDEKKEVDWGELQRVVRVAVHFLDNVIDCNKYPLKLIEEKTKGNRKIGLGIMGFADLLIKLGIPYNSEESIHMAESIGKFIFEESKKASEELAKIKGSFPNIKKSIYKEPLRNATRTTIAPTGSLSIIANCSSGIEPLFGINMKRKNILGGETLIEVNQLFEKISKERGFYSKELMQKVAELGSVQGLEEVPKDIQELFITAHEISPEWHIRIQSTFQKYIDNAVSKTINLPNSATTEDIRRIFILAYLMNCKGVTVYRDGSRKKQVLYKGNDNKIEVSPRTRPEMTNGGTVKVITGCGSLYVTINEDENGLCEVFARMGKSGGCISSHSEAIGRLISLALRSGVDIDSIIKQLNGIRCPKIVFSKEEKVLSCADAIQKAIRIYIKKGPTSLQLRLDDINSNKIDICPQCPECGAMLEHQEGCSKCSCCGYSEC